VILHASRRTRRRGGFTLLEILLAALLATLVLAAVYSLLSVTLQQTQTSRDAVEVEDLSRGVFNKFTLDLSGTLAPLPPKSGGNSAASGSQAAPTTPTTPTTSDSSGMPTTDGSAAPTTGTTTPATGTTDASTAGATDNSTAVAADYAFQGGIIGDEAKLVIYAGRTPEAFSRFGNPGEQVRADQRQIIYWLGTSGGLYRRERPWVTADGVRNAIENDEQATDSTLLADEVTALLFEYFDGSSWATTWDGTAPGPDGVTPLGPPRAIRVTLTLKIPVSRGEPVEKQVSQVIAIRSAPGTYTPPLLEAPTDGGDNAVPADPGSGMGTTPNTTNPNSPTTPNGNNNPGGSKTPSGNTNPGGGKTPSGSTPGGNTNPGSGTKGGTTPGGMTPSGKGGR
jgi:hypothetical protein